MGLNAYEIDTYTALLEEGEMTAMEISRKASVPYSKIYEVLNSLKEKGWVKSSESRPNRLLPPTATFPHLTSSRNAVSTAAS